MNHFSWMLFAVAFLGLGSLDSGRADEVREARLERLKEKAADVQQACAGANPWPVAPTIDPFLRESKDLFPPGSVELAGNLEMVAEIYRLTFRYQEADQLWGEVLEIRRRDMNRNGGTEAAVRAAFALFQLGEIASARQDVSAAARRYEEGLDILPAVPGGGALAQDRDQLQVALLEGRARMLAVTCDLEAAISQYGHAVTLAEKLDPAAPPLLARVRLNYGQALLARSHQWRSVNRPEQENQDLQESLRQIMASGNYYTRIENRTPTENYLFLAVLRSQVQCMMAGGKYEAAEQHLKRILDRNPEHLLGGSITGASFRSDHSVALFALGKRDEAKVECETALAILDRNKALTPAAAQIAQVKVELARIIGIASDPKCPEKGLQLARQSLQAQLSLLEEGFNYQTDRQRLLFLHSVRDALNTYLTLAFPDGKPLTPAEVSAAYADVLDWKGMAFARSAFDRAMAAGSPPETRPLVLLRQEYLNAAQTYREYASAPVPEGVTEKQWAEEVEKRRGERDRLERELSTEVIAGRPAADRTRPSPREVADSLPDGATLVDFVVYDHLGPGPRDRGLLARQPRVLAFVSRRGRATACIPLGPLDAITDALERWYKVLDPEHGPAPDSIPELNRRATELARMVWEPIARHPQMVGATRVLLSPDAGLWRVPFAALPGRDAQKYLIEEIDLSDVLSARQVYEMYCRKGNYAAAPGKGCLVVGAIDYGAANAKTDLTEIRDGGAWADEVEKAYAEAFPGRKPPTPMRGQAATAANLRALTAGVREIQLLGHGPLCPETATDWLLGLGRVRMPLALWNREAAGRGVANSPDAEELSMLDLHGVKAFWWWGCNVNGPGLSGEGVVGAPRALHLAGCQAVLGSCWVVHSGTARPFSRTVNRLVWQKGKGAAQALWEAQRGCLKDDTGEGRNPYYWAGSIMIGDANGWDKTGNAGQQDQSDSGPPRNEPSSLEKTSAVWTNDLPATTLGFLAVIFLSALWSCRGRFMDRRS